MRIDGAVIALGGLMPRGVLAMLLMDPNRSVSAERLAIGLWGEDTAAAAVKALRVHVSRLRKALADPELLTTTDGGYRLRVRPGELDVQRFERLAADGRDALNADDAPRAAALLHQALGLWRGPPLGDLASAPFAQTEITRLEEQRLAALEARVDADLRLARHHAITAELETLVAAHPTRERLAGQLMLALYRCARQADALQAYQRTRTHLVNELGLEPGPALKGAPGRHPSTRTITRTGVT